MIGHLDMIRALGSLSTNYKGLFSKLLKNAYLMKKLHLSLSLRRFKPVIPNMFPLN